MGKYSGNLAFLRYFAIVQNSYLVADFLYYAHLVGDDDNRNAETHVDIADKL